MLEQEKQALSARGVAFDGAISLGVMIETPAAAAMMYGSFTQDGGNAYSTRQMREPDVPL